MFFLCIGLGLFFSILTLKERSYLRIPIKAYSALGIPIISAELGGIPCSLELDLGLSHQMYVNQKVLQKIKNKKMESSTNIRDIRGNVYKTQNFLISSLRLKHWKIKDVIVSEEVRDYRSSTIFNAPSEKIKYKILEEDAKIRQGTIGWPVFSQFFCCFDLVHNEVLIGKNIAALLKARRASRELIQVPFSFSKAGIVLSITTDLGPHLFLLDTGATCSMIRKRLIDKSQMQEIEPGVGEYISSSFVFNKKDLGMWTFRLVEMSDAWDQFDGALGMDFFLKHTIFLE
jgi:hypothetical protein